MLRSGYKAADDCLHVTDAKGPHQGLGYSYEAQKTVICNYNKKKKLI